MKNSIFAILIITLLIFAFSITPLKVYAASLCNVRIIAGNSNAVASKYSTNIFFDGDIYADSVDSTNTGYVSFTNAAYGSCSNPALTFGTAVQDTTSSANVHIRGITTSYVRLQQNLGSIGKNANVTFIYSGAQPPNVQINASGLAATIYSNQYYTTYAPFITCNVPCVYWTATQTWIRLAVQAAATDIFVEFTGCSNSASCGTTNPPNNPAVISSSTPSVSEGGGFVIPPIPPVPPPVIAAITTPDYTTLGIMGFILVIGTAVAIGRLRSSGKRGRLRSPSDGNVALHAASTSTSHLQSPSPSHSQFRQPSRHRKISFRRAK